MNIIWRWTSDWTVSFCRTEHNTKRKAFKCKCKRSQSELFTASSLRPAASIASHHSRDLFWQPTVYGDCQLLQLRVKGPAICLKSMLLPCRFVSRSPRVVLVPARCLWAIHQPYRVIHLRERLGVICLVGVKHKVYAHIYKNARIKTAGKTRQRERQRERGKDTTTHL